MNSTRPSGSGASAIGLWQSASKTTLRKTVVAAVASAFTARLQVAAKQARASQRGVMERFLLIQGSPDALSD
jgi:hypothetical protein